MIIFSGFVRLGTSVELQPKTQRSGEDRVHEARDVRHGIYTGRVQLIMRKAIILSVR